MSAVICDPYELGLLAALVKSLPPEQQPNALRAMSVEEVGRMLARENIASVSYRYRDPPLEHVGRPALLDEDVVKLAGLAAESLRRNMGGATPALAVRGRCAAELAGYVSYHSGEHPGWGRSLARRACNAVEAHATTLESGQREAPLVLAEPEWGLSDATLNTLGGLMPSAVLSACIEAGGEFERAVVRAKYPVYGYGILNGVERAEPLGVVRDPKHCAQLVRRLNDDRHPAVNGDYRMVQLRAVPVHDTHPHAKRDPLYGYGIVSAEAPLAVTEDGRAAGELLYTSLHEALEQVRLKNVDDTGDTLGARGPWSAVELRAAPVAHERVREFARPDAHDLDVATARGKVLGLRDGETPHITGTLVAVAHKLRALAICEPDGLLTTVIAPDGNSLANFKGLFGESEKAPGYGLKALTAQMRLAIGKRIELLMTTADTCVSRVAGVTHEGRTTAQPIPWETVPTLRLGAGDRFMGEVLAVHQFPETTNSAGKPYTAAVEMRLGHPLVRRNEISPAPVLVVASTRAAQWRRPDGDLAEFGDAKAGDVLDVRMEVDGKTIEVRPVDRDLVPDGAIRIAPSAVVDSSTACSQAAGRQAEDDEQENELDGGLER